MSITQILYHHNLLANVLKFIINDCMGLFRVCKIINLSKAEHLAQYYVGLQTSPVVDEDREYIRKCIHKYRNNPTALFDGTWYEYCRTKEMLYAVKNGADFIKTKCCVLDLVLEYRNPNVLEIFKILMSKGNDYLQKFVDRWHLNFNGVDYNNWGNNMIKYFWMIPDHYQKDKEFKELIKILWQGAGNPLPYYWSDLWSLVCCKCLDFISREDIDKHYSPDRKYVLTFTRKLKDVLVSDIYTYKTFDYSYDLHTSDKVINLDQYILSQYHGFQKIDVLTTARWVSQNEIEFIYSQDENNNKKVIYNVNQDLKMNHATC
jgi:hypothetical protein